MYYLIFLVNNMDVIEIKYVLLVVYNSEKKNESINLIK